MFNQYDSPLMLPPSYGNYEPEPEQDSDRIDYALEGTTRFAGLFSLGVSLTLFCRWIPALQPVYWIAAIAAMLALALPAYLARSARLLALAIALAVAIFTGWFDQISYASQQAQHQIQEVIHK